tara:strand:+ start:49 stop:1548 length:1500 start_codon:yes stop_codon:yes gene_type:complete
MPYIGEKLSAAGKVQNMEGVELQLDADGDTGITADTDDQVDIKVGGTDTVKIAADGNITFTSTLSGADDSPTLRLQRDSSSPAINDELGEIIYGGKDDGGNDVTYVIVDALIKDETDGTEDGMYRVRVAKDGSMIDSLSIDADECVINEGSTDRDFRVESDDKTHMLFVDGASDHVNIGTSTDYGGVLNVLSTGNDDTLALVSTDADASLGPVLNMRRNSSSPADNDVLGAITFEGEDSASGINTYAMIQTKALDVTNGSEDGMLQFIVDKDDTLISGLNIGSSEIVFNEDSADVDFRIESNSSERMLEVDASNNGGTVAISRDIAAGDSLDTNQLEVYGSIRAQSGILFGSDTSTDNMLSDYEEGTFVPSQTFSSADPTAGARAGEGRYVKIGSLVTVMIKINNVLSSGASGDIRINNMPFTSKADAGDGQVSAFVGTASVNHVNYSGSTYCTAELLDNTSIMRITENVDNSARDQLAVGNFSHNTSDIFASVTYQVA